MIDWHEMFFPSHSVFEVIVRGSLMYLGIYFVLRIVLKRQTGALGVTDLLLITLLADASQNGMTGDYRSVTEGMALVITLMFWDFALDWLSYHSQWFHALTAPPPIILVRNGRLLKANMRRELITLAELKELLREQGVEDIDEVAQATMESSGHFSVIKRESGKSKKD
ncbi:MAG: DUF421 domain-containing protein [Aureliella sp.]